MTNSTFAKTQVLLTLLFQAALFAQVLHVRQTIQEQDQWCWAGVSCAELKYYDHDIAQCTIAEYTRTHATWHSFGSVDCCADPSKGCNYWNYNWGYAGSIQAILQNWGINNSGVGSALGKTAIQTQIGLKRPFIIRWGWTSGGGHFLVGYGIGADTSTIYYMNPWPGEGSKIAQYDWMVSGSNHTWTHTNVINTTPGPPAVPALVDPADRAAYQPVTMTFRWTASVGAVSWHMQVATDSLFADPVIDDTVMSASQTVSDLQPATRYFWRVAASNDAAAGNYAPMQSFTTRDRCGIPALLQPADSAVNQPASPLLIWRADPNTESYRLEVATDGQFSHRVVSAAALTDSSRSIGPLDLATLYYWRVRASNSFDTGSWSPVRTFRTIVPLPETAALQWPPNHAVLANDTIGFLWRLASPEVTAYRIRISADSAAGPVVIDSTLADTVLVLNGFEWERHFFWKVCALNAAGWGPSSPMQWFMPHQRTAIINNVAFSARWNMVSNPVIAPNDSVSSLYPGVVMLSNPIDYVAGVGYQQEVRMEPGTGFWLKLRDSGTVAVTGLDIAVDSISVAEGWNMIGSISYPVDTAAVLTEPEGIRLSSYFSYHNGYSSAEVIEPGKAYWVKVSRPGVIRLIHQFIMGARTDRKNNE